jgi:hypothetical protein
VPGGHLVARNAHGVDLAVGVSWFMTRFKSRGAHVCEEQWHARDMRVHIGLGLREDTNPTSCVHRCIMIHWVETPSALLL